jgi:hypothetical protein
MDAVTDAAGDKRADVVFQLACIDRTPQEFQQQLHSLQDQGDEGAPIWKKSASRFGIDWRSIVSAALFERPAPSRFTPEGSPLCESKTTRPPHKLVPNPSHQPLLSADAAWQSPKLGGKTNRRC